MELAGNHKPGEAHTSQGNCKIGSNAFSMLDDLTKQVMIGRFNDRRRGTHHAPSHTHLRSMHEPFHVSQKRYFWPVSRCRPSGLTKCLASILTGVAWPW